MRAVVCRKFGGPEDLELADVEPPQLKPGAVRIAVKACGLNFGDSLIISGGYQVKPEFPFSPGMEVSGEIMECGDGVEGLAVGDRVMGMPGFGGYAEQVVVPASDVLAMPDNMGFEEAAAFPVVYGTSHLGLKEKARLQAGDILLVHGAAGGVGLTAVEIGKLMGATVIATAGGAEKLAVAGDYGADHLIDYRTEDVKDRVKEITGGRGVDVVYDPVGGDIFDISLRCVAPDARLLIVGFAAGKIQQIPANLLLVKNVSAMGFYWGGHRLFAPEAIQRSFDELVEWYAAGKLRPHISHTFPLEQAAEALETLKARKSTGKVVLTKA